MSHLTFVVLCYIFALSKQQPIHLLLPCEKGANKGISESNILGF